MDQMVNNIQLTWKLAWLLRTYRTYNSTVVFSKYKFYNKLLGGVTLLKIILDITLTQPIYIYIYILYHRIISFALIPCSWLDWYIRI